MQGLGFDVMDVFGVALTLHDCFSEGGRGSIASIPLRDQSYTDIDGSYITPATGDG